MNMFDGMSPVGLSAVACLLGFQIPADKAKMPAGFCNIMREIPCPENVTIGQAVAAYLAHQTAYFKALP